MTKFEKLIQSIRQMRRSQEEWKAIERDEKRKEDVIIRARVMMRAASLQYQNAVKNSKREELQNLTKKWSPKRVLSVNKAFKALCVELENTEVWNKLRGHERKFITEAYRLIQS